MRGRQPWSAKNCGQTVFFSKGLFYAHHLNNVCNKYFLPKEIIKNVLKTILFLFSRRIITFLCAAFEGPPLFLPPSPFSFQFSFFFVGNRMLPDADFFFRKSGKGKGGKKCSFAFFHLALDLLPSFPRLQQPISNLPSFFICGEADRSGRGRCCSSCCCCCCWGIWGDCFHISHAH